ncbi:hypothetical protein ACFMQL_20450 [Nonomuraea fastidiosa]|uniref:hypothetical protein n=1 Tax=Nonomuraea fastidiosa TaxID=46173 RepID=UPI00366D3487
MSAQEIILAIGGGLLVNEFCDISPWAARRIVAWSARVKYGKTTRAEIRAEEWEAVIAHRPGKLFKLATALGFSLQAGAMWTSRLLILLWANMQAKLNFGHQFTLVESTLRKIVKRLPTRNKQVFSGSQQRSMAALNDASLTPIVDGGFTVLVDYRNAVAAHVPGCSCVTD